MDSVTSASSTWGTGRVAKAPVRPARTPLPDAPLQRPYKGMPPSPEPLAASSSDSDLTGATPTLSKQQDVLVETPDYDSFLSKSSINGGNSTMKRPMQRSADDQESPIKKHRVARNKDPATYAVKAKMKLAGVSFEMLIEKNIDIGADNLRRKSTREAQYVRLVSSFGGATTSIMIRRRQLSIRRMRASS